MKAAEIVNKINGVESVPAINAELERNGYRVYLAEAEDKILTPSQRDETTANVEAGILTGFAMVNVQVGCLEKMEVVDGTLVHPVNARLTGYMGGVDIAVDGDTVTVVA